MLSLNERHRTDYRACYGASERSMRPYATVCSAL
jgi:hypothetical protein